MGVFLFSNKQIDTKPVEDVFESRGHRNIEIKENTNGTLIHAGKVLVNNKGALYGKELCGEENDFIVGVGTYVYNGAFGDDALPYIWKDWETVLKNNLVYGHWAFVVHKNGYTYVVNDMTGSLRLYYVIDSETGGVSVSSSMVSMIATLKDPTFDKIRLSGFFAGEYGREIPFVKGIEMFNSLAILAIKDGTCEYEWKMREIPEVRRIEKMDVAKKYVVDLFKEQIDVLKAIGNEKISIELTGGLDSRLITANIRKAGFNYDFINYPIFGPDAEVSGKIASGLNKRLLNQTNIPLKEGFDKYYGEFDYGFNYFRQYANPRWVIENRLQLSGALGECISTPLSIDFLKAPKLKNILPYHIIGPLMPKKIKDKYLNYAESYFEKRGLKPDAILTEKEITKYETMLLGQITGDFMYNSGAQAHIYFYNIYVEWHFNHFITDIAVDLKKGRKLTLELIKSIDTELGSYNFVSRRRTKGKSVNETKELPLKYFSYDVIKNMLPKSFVDFLYERIGRRFDTNRFNTIDIDRYIDVIDTRELKKHRNLYSDILNRIYSVEILRKKFDIA